MPRTPLIVAASVGAVGLLAASAWFLWRPSPGPASPATAPPSSAREEQPAAQPIETFEQAQAILAERLQTLGRSCAATGSDETAIRAPRTSKVLVTVVGGSSDDRTRIQHDLETFVEGDSCLRIAPLHVWSDRSSPAYLGGATADRTGLEVVAFVGAGAADSVYIYDHDIRRALGEIVTATRRDPNAPR